VVERTEGKNPFNGGTMQKPMRFFEVVRKSIRQRLFRNIATIFCFALVTSSLLSAYFLVGGAENSVQAGIARLGADVMVVPFQYGDQTQSVILTGKPSTFTFDHSVKSEVDNISGVTSASPQLFVATLSKHPCCSGSFQLIGIDPENDFTITPWLHERLDRQLGKDEVIVGSKISGEVGSALKFYGHTFSIVGRLDSTGMGLDSSVFLRLEDAYVMAEESAQKADQPLNITRGEISALMVRIDPGSDPTSVANDIMLSVNGTSAVASTQFSKQVSDRLTSTTQVLYVATAAITIVLIPMVAIISSMVANERKRELGLLRAMGATKPFVFSLVFVESLSLAIFGGLIGVVLTSLIIVNFQTLITSSLNVPFLWPSLPVVLGESALAVSLSLAIGSVSSLLPAIASCRLEPYDAIRKGES
jgi:putative ABC transport system permease protein